MKLHSNRTIARLLLCISLISILTSCDKPKPVPIQQPAGIGNSIEWKDLPGWSKDKHAEVWPALLQSCKIMKFRKKEWIPICKAAKKLESPSNDQAKNFFELWFKPHKIYNDQGKTDGLITGYYEPILKGSLTPSKEYAYPIYKWPHDLLIVELDSLHPDLKGKRLRGRIVGRKVVPYFSRADIDKQPNLFKGNELAWVKDPVDLFFLQIQGSGRIQLPNNKTISVGYAQQNGHPYIAIGAILIRNGEIERKDISLKSIREWLKKNPKKTFELLHTNPSYVFFRTLDSGLPGPLGALNLPLTAERSIAVDPKTISLGIPVWLNTKLPTGDNDKSKEQTYQRLMFAQDTGGAIRGAVRADVFWGNGKRAEFYAGHMKQDGELYALLPKAEAK